MKKLFLKLKENIIEYFIVLSVIATLIFASTLFSGCSTKIIEKPVYIEKKCPTLKTYDLNETYKITAYKKGNKFYVEEWNATVDKEVVYDLFKYIKRIKGQLKKCNEEIKIYNKKFGN